MSYKKLICSDDESDRNLRKSFKLNNIQLLCRRFESSIFANSQLSSASELLDRYNVHHYQRQFLSVSKSPRIRFGKSESFEQLTDSFYTSDESEGKHFVANG